MCTGVKGSGRCVTKVHERREEERSDGWVVGWEGSV